VTEQQQYYKRVLQSSVMPRTTYLRVNEGAVDPDALAGLGAPKQSGEDGALGVQPSCQICDTRLCQTEPSLIEFGVVFLPVTAHASGHVSNLPQPVPHATRRATRLTCNSDLDWRTRRLARNVH